MLFLAFGCGRLTDYSGTVAYMTQKRRSFAIRRGACGNPIDFVGDIALILDVWTRPLAVLFAVYTLATALIGHRYWTITGYARFTNMTNFYKNVSLMGGSSCGTARALEKLDRRKVGTAWCAAATDAGSVNASNGGPDCLGENIDNVWTAPTGMPVCACGVAHGCPG